MSYSISWEEIPVNIMILQALAILVGSLCWKVLEFVALVILMVLAITAIVLLYSNCLELVDILENPEVDLQEKIKSVFLFVIFFFLFIFPCLALTGLGFRSILGVSKVQSWFARRRKFISQIY